MMREQLADAVDRRALCVMTFPVSPEGITSAFHFDSRPTSEVLAPRELVVPLGSLLVRIFRAEFNNFNNFSIKVAPLLSALFCGNQIIVDVHPDCGVSSKSVIASLAEVLPRALRRMQPAATEYLPPNLSRMIAFSPRKEIVVTRETEHFGKDVFALADLADHQDLTVPSIVLLELTPTSAKVSDATQVLRDAGVLEAPRSRECSQRTKRDSDMGPYGPFTKSPLSYATLVNRILVAVKLHCEKTANADADRLPVEESLLQCQIVQTVREYVCRGRLYTKMLRRQKEDEFRVAMAGRQQKQSFASRVLNLFRRASTPAGPEVSKSRRPSAVAVDPEDTLQPLPRYEKQQSGLSAVSRSSRFVSPEESDPNYRPQKSLAVSDLCDVLPADHSILVFLGTAPSPFGPREAED
jgi:hypothetical protein